MKLFNFYFFLMTMQIERSYNPRGFWEKQWENNSENLISYYAYGLIRPKGSILDIGCGNSHNNIPEIADYFVGVDISETALRLSNKCRRSDFVLASAADLPFKNGSFDSVISIETLTLLGSNAYRAIEEMNRLAKSAVTFTVTHTDILNMGDTPNTRLEYGTLFHGDELDIITFTEDDIGLLLTKLRLKPKKVRVLNESEVRNYGLPSYQHEWCLMRM